MYPGIKAVKALPDYKVLLTLDNEEKRLFDMEPYLDRCIFQELKNPQLFNTVHISFDTLEWNNGADLCPEVLVSKSVSGT